MLTMPTIYEVPLVLEDSGLGDFICDRLNLNVTSRDLEGWRSWVERLKRATSSLNVAVVGKYVELPDAYLSVKEALIHAGVQQDIDVNVKWVHSESVDEEGEALFRDVDGIVVPGGFGERGFEGKVKAARYARTNHVPYLGLCLGLQVMVVELAREVLGTEDANSAEFDPETSHPIISLLDEQLRVVDKGGTMRLGAYPCKLVPGTKTHEAYARDETAERHRHRYEFNNEYKDLLGSAGLVCSGTSPDGALVEICEIAGHPWMVGSQFHPEFRSRPGDPHPLFSGFVAAAAARSRSEPASSAITHKRRASTKARPSRAR